MEIDHFWDFQAAKGDGQGITLTGCEASDEMVRRLLRHVCVEKQAGVEKLHLTSLNVKSEELQTTSRHFFSIK